MSAEFDATAFLATLSHRPGCYRMLDAEDNVLYVGKARDLKKRVSTYFGSKSHHPKTQALMSRAARVEVTVTGTEREALLLEYNLIKEHKPRFNVLLRDDKSYPYIHVTTEQAFPRFEFHRGARRKGTSYFGPYPSAGAVRQTLGQLQRLFRVRQCKDSYFANRSRPCLQYQIKRCTAPCVGLIDPEAYARDVDNAKRFLSGKNDAVLADLQTRMDAAASGLDYEGAAQFRDQITAIREVQAKQFVSGSRTRDADILAAESDGQGYCVASIMIRGSRMLGGRNFFPRTVTGTEPGEVLSAFILQHYLVHAPPPEIIVNGVVDAPELLEGMLGDRVGHQVQIRSRVRGTRRRWLEMAATNARQALETQRAASASVAAQLKDLTEGLGLERVPDRIECFDISHTAGAETVASCVVFGSEGAIKSAYRRFNIRDVEPGDDYAAMAQAVRRRYARLRKEEARLPDLVLIDGGRGQLGKALEVFAELGIDSVQLAGVAKGEGRKAGREKIYLPELEAPLRMPGHSAALHLIQQIRDEAHRFAITGHRQRRGKAKQVSELEAIPGLGPARRKALLRQFGGLQGVRRSGVDDLAKVKGISRALAQRIYDRLHGG
jgi:excinuclease ABC subunit C